jgi:hypothetical protein
MLPLQTGLETRRMGLMPGSTAAAVEGSQPSCDLCQTLVQYTVMAAFFIYITPCFGAQGWTIKGPDESFVEICFIHLVKLGIKVFNAPR